MRRKPSTRFKFKFTNSHPSEAAIDVQRVRFFFTYKETGISRGAITTN